MGALNFIPREVDFILATLTVTPHQLALTFQR